MKNALHGKRGAGSGDSGRSDVDGGGAAVRRNSTPQQYTAAVHHGGALYHAGTMIDLNSDVLNLSGLTLVAGNNINHFGQIVRWARNPDGTNQIVVLTPVPAWARGGADCALRPLHMASARGASMPPYSTRSSPVAAGGWYRGRPWFRR